MNALARGDEIFERYTIIAILLVPSWIAGIHRVRSSVYLPTNAAGAALWALGIGLGAYFVGPTIIDLVQDVGTATAIAVAALVVAGVGGSLLRRRVLRGRRAGAGEDADSAGA
jgi:membrane protein DedA with SNARE-associated domain